MIRIITNSLAVFRLTVPLFSFCDKKKEEKVSSINERFTDKATEEDKDRPITNGTVASI